MVSRRVVGNSPEQIDGLNRDWQRKSIAQSRMHAITNAKLHRLRSMGYVDPNIDFGDEQRWRIPIQSKKALPHFKRAIRLLSAATKEVKKDKSNPQHSERANRLHDLALRSQMVGHDIVSGNRRGSARKESGTMFASTTRERNARLRQGNVTESDEELRELERHVAANPTDTIAGKRLHNLMVRIGKAQPLVKGMQRSELRLKKMEKAHKEHSEKHRQLTHRAPFVPLGSPMTVETQIARQIDGGDPIDVSATKLWRLRGLHDIAKARHNIQIGKHREKTPEVIARIMKDARSSPKKRVTPETRKDEYDYLIAKGKKETGERSPIATKKEKAKKVELPWSYKRNWRSFKRETRR